MRNLKRCSFILLLASPALAGETLSLDEYLNQVRGKHEGIKANVEQKQAGLERSHEAELLTAWTLFGNAQLLSDARQSINPTFSYTSQEIQSANLGLSKLTTFGLQAKVYYGLNAIQYNNALVAGSPTAYTFSMYQASPTIELTQSLLSNGFGRGTRATLEMNEASALASSYAASFQSKVSLVDAETTFWRLALARQNVQVSRDAVERARKIYEWSQRRARLNLADQGDALQAEAALKSRGLELQAAADEEHAASRAFNSARSSDSDVVTEQLPELTPDMIDRLQIPKRAELRDDVKAAQQQQLAAAAQAQTYLERDLPTLDVYASYALNGLSPASFTPGPNGLPDRSLGEATASSFSLDHPTKALGIRFSVPIDLPVTFDSRRAWARERDASELAYQRKVFEQDESWRDLNQRLTDARRRLDLARQIEQVQESKLTNERKRLQAGRTTTFQVLQFEQDFASSQLARIRTQAEVLNLLAQMKLFGETL